MSNYWGNRINSAQNHAANKGIDQINARIAKYYRRASKDIINDYIALYNQLIAELSADGEISPNDLYRLDRFAQLQAKVADKLKALTGQENTAIIKGLQDAYTGISKAIDLPIKQSDTVFTVLSDAKSKAIANSVWCADGKVWSQRIWQNTAQLQQSLEDGLIKTIVKGDSSAKLKAELRQQFNVSFRQADRLVRTEMTHVQTEAAADRYKDAGVTEYEILVAEDERLCNECGAMHGKRFPITEKQPGINAPPFHPNCRCTIIPVLPDLADSDE